MRRKKAMEYQPQKMEFSKKLTIVDITSWLFLCLMLLIILLIRPELGNYVQSLFTYITTAYVSLRLGYTAKAGVENYKKITESFRLIEEAESEDDEEDEEGIAG